MLIRVCLLTAFSILLLTSCRTPPSRDNKWRDATYWVGLGGLVLPAATSFGQFPSRQGSVHGFRFNTFVSMHTEMYGFDLGLIGGGAEKFSGTAVNGIYNYTQTSATVILSQIAGITNINSGTTNIYGVQLAAFLNNNIGAGKTVGVQVSLINLSSESSIYGLQLGAFNRAKKVVGFQVGIMNMAKELYGLQIGLINLNSNGPLKFFPLINVGF